MSELHFRPDVMKDASPAVRAGVAVLYWPVALTVVTAQTLWKPVLFTYEVWDRLFQFLGIWDEPFPVFANMVTWLGPAFFTFMAVAAYLENA